MITSFIEINDIGFWANDGFAEAMQLCLINEIESSSLEFDNWINEFKLELALQSFPLICGGMSMCLEEFLNANEQRKLVVVQLSKSVIDKIENDNNYLTGQNLAKFRRRAMTILNETDKKNYGFKNNRELEKAFISPNWTDSTIHSVKKSTLMLSNY